MTSCAAGNNAERDQQVSKVLKLWALTCFLHVWVALILRWYVMGIYGFQIMGPYEGHMPSVLDCKELGLRLRPDLCAAPLSPHKYRDLKLSLKRPASRGILEIMAYCLRGLEGLHRWTMEIRLSKVDPTVPGPLVC